MIDKEVIIRLISEGKTEEAIQQFLVETRESDTSRYNAGVLLLGRYKRLKEQQIRNVISNEQRNVEISAINSALLEVLRFDNEKPIYTSTSSQVRWKLILSVLIGVAIASSVLWLYYNNKGTVDMVSGKILVNSQVQAGVTVLFDDFDKHLLTDKNGNFSFSVEEFEPTIARIVYNSFDSLIEVRELYSIINLKMEANNVLPNSRDSLKNFEEFNQIIDSDRSVIQKGNNSTVDFN